MRASVTCEAMLPAGAYLVLPLSLRPRSHVGSPALRYVLRVGSAKAVICTAAAASADDCRFAVAAYCKHMGRAHRAFDGMTLYSVHDGSGWLTYAENAHSYARFTINLSHENSFNVLPARGSLATYDVLMPGRGQLLQCLSLGYSEDGSRMRSDTKFTCDPMSQEMHSPIADGLYASTPLHAGGGSGGMLNNAQAGLSDLLASLGVRFIG